MHIANHHSTVKERGKLDVKGAVANHFLAVLIYTPTSEAQEGRVNDDPEINPGEGGLILFRR